MPDNGEATSEPTQAPEQNATGATPNDVAELGDPGKRAIAAEREARKAAEKQAEAFRAQLDEIKKSQMSDLEKAQAAAQELQAEAAKARSEALRWRIAAKHGISDEDAETFLTGADEATLTRQAERLAALATTAGPATPKPDRTQGGSGAPHALNSDGLEEALRSKLGI
jgi:hypothetical protein